MTKKEILAMALMASIVDAVKRELTGIEYQDLTAAEKRIMVYLSKMTMKMTKYR